MSGPAPESRPEAVNGPRVLRAAGLTKSYGRRVVVQHVDLEIRQGEVVGLLGPNGAGKTTTFYMVVGLARPGQRARATSATRTSPALPMYLRARQGIGYLPQEASVFRRLTTEQNVLRDPGEPRACRRRSSAPRARELLEELGIQAHGRASPPTRFRAGSGAGSRSAARSPPTPSFILLDEPFAGIDPIAVIDIQKIIAHLRDRGIGVLITDHNVRETLKITDRAYILREGEVFRSGTPERARLRRGGPQGLPRRGLPARRDAAGALSDPTAAEPERDPSLAIQQKLGLSTRLSQRLILTPSLQQAIKLLPLTTLELAEVLEQEVMENPLLEEVPQEQLSAEEIAQEEAEAEEREGRSPQGDRRREVLRGLPRRRRPPPHAQRRDPGAAAHREHAHRARPTSTTT